MSTRSNRLGLNIWTDGDAFHISEHSENAQIEDASPGTLICTSSTRPSSWSAAQSGMSIYETDTKLSWRWTGTAFERLNPKGWLNSNSRTTSVSTGGTGLVVAVQATVAIPAGGRSVLVVVEGSGVSSTVGVTSLAIFRDTTQLQAWNKRGGPGSGATDQPEPVIMTTMDTPVAGTYNYSLRFAAMAGYGGTSTLLAATNQPLAIHVVET